MTARTTHGLGIAALFLLVAMTAAPALASGGSLEPFPDLLADCLKADCRLGSDPLGALAASKLVHLLIAFVLLVPVANAMLFRPMLAMLDERDARIEGASRRADEVAARADEVFGRYDAAVAAARKEAEEERRRILEEARASQARVTSAARSEAEQRVADARTEVAGATEAARGTLRSEGTALARAVAEQVLGRAL